MSFRSCRIWLLCLVLLPAGSPAPSADEPAKLPEVPVARPVVREVTDYEEFTGRTEASSRVELRALLTGYLVKAACQEGAEVKKGDLLFEINPILYQARLDTSLAEVELEKVALKRAQASPQARSEVDLALARVKLAELRAELQKAELSFCKLTAPFSGRIAKTYVTPGNLVNEKETLLAVLVNDNPLWVFFGIDERTILRVRASMREDKEETPRLSVAIRLPGEEDFPHRGLLDSFVLDFKNETGTISTRAVLDNKNRRLAPGMFVRVRLTLSAPRKALLVVERAIRSDGRRKYVYVIDAENKVQFRLVEVGQLQPDGLRVISEGLEPEDRVVIGRLSILRMGMTVRPQAAEMPALKRPKPPEEAPSRKEGTLLPRRQGGSGILVEATYPGASAETVADAVRIPIEMQVTPLEKIEYLRSRCTSDGKYALAVAFAPGVDLWRAQMLVQNRVALAGPALPAEVQNAGVSVQRGTSGVLLLVNLFSTADGHNGAFLRNYANIFVKDPLSRLPGVGEVSLLGGGEPLRLTILLNPERLAAYRLNAGDVTRVLEKKKKGRDADPESLAKLPVRQGNGEVLLLGDVASVDFAADRPRGLALSDGKPVATLAVRLTGEESPRKVAVAVRERLAHLRTGFPPGLDYEINFDFTANLEGAGSPAASEYLLVDIDLPAGSVERTALMLKQSETVLRQLPGVRHVLAMPENPFDPFGGPPCLLVLLNLAEQRKTAREEIIKTIRTKLGKREGGTVRLRDLSAPGGFPRCGYPIDLALRGPDLDEVREWSARLAEKLKQSNKLTDLWVDPASTTRPGVVVDIDRKAAAALGVALDDITHTIEVSSGPLPVNTFLRYGRAWPVAVQGNPGAGHWTKDLDLFKVRNKEGQMVPLAILVKVRQVEAPPVLDFLNLYPMVEITANLDPGVSVEQGRRLCTLLADGIRKQLGLSAEYRLTWLR